MSGQVLLRNMYGGIARQADGVILCQCKGLVVSGLLFAGGAVFLSGALVAVALLNAKLALGVLIGPLLMGGAMTALGIRRRRMHGVFRVDPGAGSFIRGRGEKAEALSLERVRGPWMIRDYTDGMSRSPHWLVVEVDGRRFRLAKGSPQELGPTIQALAAIGLSARRR